LKSKSGFMANFALPLCYAAASSTLLLDELPGPTTGHSMLRACAGTRLNPERNLTKREEEQAAGDE
jgi:hypothetical protein